jgi:hypothetical protein
MVGDDAHDENARISDGTNGKDIGSPVIICDDRVIGAVDGANKHVKTFDGEVSSLANSCKERVIYAIEAVVEIVGGDTPSIGAMIGGDMIGGDMHGENALASACFNDSDVSSPTLLSVCDTLSIGEIALVSDCTNASDASFPALLSACDESVVGFIDARVGDDVHSENALGSDAIFIGVYDEMDISDRDSICDDYPQVIEIMDVSDDDPSDDLPADGTHVYTFMFEAL